jgi:hypothetical protein
MRPLIKMLRSYLIRAQTGWSLTNHAEELTTPSAALRWLRDFFFMPQPPLLS